MAIPQRQQTGQTIKQAWQENNSPLGNTKPGLWHYHHRKHTFGHHWFDIETPAASGSGMKTYNANTGLWEGYSIYNIQLPTVRVYAL